MTFGPALLLLKRNIGPPLRRQIVFVDATLAVQHQVLAVVYGRVVDQVGGTVRADPGSGVIRGRIADYRTAGARDDAVPNTVHVIVGDHATGGDPGTRSFSNNSIPSHDPAGDYTLSAANYGGFQPFNDRALAKIHSKPIDGKRSVAHGDVHRLAKKGERFPQLFRRYALRS